jgi:thiamine kinase-like enzyme
MPEVAAKFDPGAAVERYARQLGTPEAGQLAEQCLDLLGECRQMQDSVCLCHNDLLNHNIMESDRAMLIDWEFAGMGDPWFDLAVVIEHHALGEKLGRQFLNAYLERKATDAELDRLWKNCEFYAVLLKLWMLRVGDL